VYTTLEEIEVFREALAGVRAFFGVTDAPAPVSPTREGVR
jgi:cysteine desulfurase/selenocysteine lyase